MSGGKEQGRVGVGRGYTNELMFLLKATIVANPTAAPGNMVSPREGHFSSHEAE